MDLFVKKNINWCQKNTSGSGNSRNKNTAAMIAAPLAMEYFLFCLPLLHIFLFSVTQKKNTTLSVF